MEEKQLLQKVDEMLQGKIITKCIDNVNHTLGHPYTIGPKHITHAADHFGGMLGEAAIQDMEKGGGCCAHPGCRATYGEHLSDRVLFLSLTQNLTNDEANALLQPVGALLTENDIAGIAFVDTSEKYRIK